MPKNSKIFLGDTTELKNLKIYTHCIFFYILSNQHNYQNTFQTF